MKENEVGMAWDYRVQRIASSGRIAGSESLVFGRKHSADKHKDLQQDIRILEETRPEYAIAGSDALDAIRKVGHRLQEAGKSEVEILRGQITEWHKYWVISQRWIVAMAARMQELDKRRDMLVDSLAQERAKLQKAQRLYRSKEKERAELAETLAKAEQKQTIVQTLRQWFGVRGAL